MTKQWLGVVLLLEACSFSTCCLCKLTWGWGKGAGGVGGVQPATLMSMHHWWYHPLSIHPLEPVDARWMNTCVITFEVRFGSRRWIFQVGHKHGDPWVALLELRPREQGWVWKSVARGVRRAEPWSTRTSSPAPSTFHPQQEETRAPQPAWGCHP